MVGGGSSTSSTRDGRGGLGGGVSDACNGGRWDERFLAVQGYRLVWWRSEDDVDAGVVRGMRGRKVG